MKKTVLYIGNFSFPLGNAAGKRVYANGKILKELGYEVIFIGMDKEVNRLEPLKNTRKEYDGFIYYNFSYPQSNLDWVKYKKTFKVLTSFLVDKNIVDDLALVIYYGSPRLSLFNTMLINYCNSRNIKVVTDCVDWLTTKTNNFIFDAVKWADNTYQKAYANKKADGVIAISSYLANYYNDHNCLTVVIPPLSPDEYMLTDVKRTQNDKKVITYAGLPFRKGQQVKDCNMLKDRIDKTIMLFHQAKKDGCKFVFNIYGFTKEEYLQAIPQQKIYVDELGASIVFHGLKPNEEVVDSVINSDFTILIRDVNRNTTAGFPTKVSESISCGTPVITTRTSDLEFYIKKGQNGFYLEFNEICIDQLVKILSMGKEEMEKMKRFCITENPFLYSNYIEKMNCFIKGVLK